MKEINKNIVIKYDYIKYNGNNAEDVFVFAQRHNILCTEESEPFVMRPADIPNLDEAELIKWWASTGKIKTVIGYSSEYTYNTHNSNNMPTWRKDEDFYLVFASGRDGYCNYEYFKKGMGVVVIGHKYCIVNFENDDELEEYVDEMIDNIIETLI